jgi:DNA replication and repair protein RecF
MIIRSIQLDFFRNYLHLETSFSPQANLIYGENAQGKTNLLEAISYFSSAQSHRARFDRELIQFGVDHAFLKGEIFSRQRDFSLEMQLHRAGRRQIYSNGVRLKTAGELAGIFQTVLFCPEDLSLIRDGAAARRKFLDVSLCQLRPRYAAALGEYRRLYEHKTRILRDSWEKPSLLETLDEFSLRMAQMGAVIIHYRAHLIRKLQEYVPAIHRDFSGGREELSLQYQTVKTISDPLAPTKELFSQLLAHQESHRQAELESRSCLSGPHKDDLEVLLDGMPAKTYGSQGQTRTAALSLKLGTREIFFQDSGEYPVLLLDDVLSELDAKRQEFVLQRIGGGQVFITCCEEDKLEQLKGGQVFRIHGGALCRPEYPPSRRS